MQHFIFHAETFQKRKKDYINTTYSEICILSEVVSYWNYKSSHKLDSFISDKSSTKKEKPNPYKFLALLRKAELRKARSSQQQTRWHSLTFKITS